MMRWSGYILTSFLFACRKKLRRKKKESERVKERNKQKESEIIYK